MSTYLDRINAAVQQNVPKAREVVPISHCKVWWTRECTWALINKNRAFSKHKRHRGNIEYFIAFKKQRAIFRKTVNEAKQKIWKEYISNLKPNLKSECVWKAVTAINNHRNTRDIIINFVLIPVT